MHCKCLYIDYFMTECPHIFSPRTRYLEPKNNRSSNADGPEDGVRTAVMARRTTLAVLQASEHIGNLVSLFV